MSTETAVWHRVGEVAALFAERRCHGIEIAGRRIGLFLIDQSVYAIDDVCTHGQALLTDGEVEGYEVECPLHAGLFDVRSGKALTAPLSRDARVYATRIDDGVLHVGYPDGQDE
ncbi:non-heme iron oxygenase ferredoxin subunit [Burkholderia sp. MR1-5-21]